MTLATTEQPTAEAAVPAAALRRGFNRGRHLVSDTQATDFRTKLEKLCTGEGAQAKLSRQLGVAEVMLSRWRRGLTGVSPKTYKAYCPRLNQLLGSRHANEVRWHGKPKHKAKPRVIKLGWHPVEPPKAAHPVDALAVLNRVARELSSEQRSKLLARALAMWTAGV